MRIRKSAGLAISLMLAVAGSAAAHYTFILPEKFRVSPGADFVVGYHAANGFPDSTQLPKRLEQARLHTARTSVLIPSLREDGLRQVASVTAPSGYFILTAINPARTESMRPNSFLSYLKEENLTEVIEAREKLGETDKPGRERYSMYLKSIALAGTPDDGYKHVVGLPIEIIPEKDPSQVKPGDTLPFRVLVKGAPAANLQIFAASTGIPAKSVGKTDSNGRLSIPVGSGRWRLHTIQMVRVVEPDADWESFWATLTFEIP